MIGSKKKRLEINEPCFKERDVELYLKLPDIETLCNPEPKDKRIVLHRRLSRQMSELIILLRFGSSNDFTRRYKTIREISDIIGVKQLTIVSLIRRYKKNNGSFEYPSQARFKKIE